MWKWIVLAIVILVVLFLVIAFTVDGEREERIAILLHHLEGLSGYGYKDNVGLEIKKDKAYIEFENSKKEKTILPFKQIVSVNFVTWEKTITKALNPLAEGIVGGLIGGDAMAVVSAINAKGRTRSEKVKVEGALEIRYYPQGEYQAEKCLVFGEVASQYMICQFAKTLCRYANLPTPQYITPKPKGPTYL